jgi:hypothetical protein
LITEFIPASIHCVAGAKAKLGDLAEQRNGFLARGEKFACTQCFATWEAGDFSGAMEPDKVTCSNCYGTKVIVTLVRVQVLEPKDCL